jgi:putative SOS response-associated peptidase YedK
MCGRLALYTPPHRLARLLEATVAAGVAPEGEPSFNVGPTRTLVGVTDRGNGRVLDAYRWGLVPYFAKDPAVGARAFNARAETVTTKAAFRDAFQRRRLLVPVDGFFEWDHRDDTRTPHYFTRADATPIVFAGLYERWRDRSAPDDAPWLKSCTILTTTPGADLDGIHDRMPVVLEPGAFDLWLTAADDERDALLGLCTPAPAGTLVHHPVDRAVGNVNNDYPELLDAVAATVAPPSLFDGIA